MLERSVIGLSTVLAHQGGWDEILLVAGPVVIIVALLAVAKRRVDRIAAAEQPNGAHPVDRPTEPAELDEREIENGGAPRQ
jgi:hypothetical protein